LSDTPSTVRSPRPPARRIGARGDQRPTRRRFGSFLSERMRAAVNDALDVPGTRWRSWRGEGVIGVGGAEVRGRGDKFALQTAYPAQGYSQIHIFTFDQFVSRLSAYVGGGIGDLGPRSVPVTRPSQDCLHAGVAVRPPTWCRMPPSGDNRDGLERSDGPAAMGWGRQRLLG
jgi:hypothetical protein